MGKAFKASVRYRHRLKAPTLGETCSECGGDVKIIASIENPEVIRKKLLRYLSVSWKRAFILPNLRDFLISTSSLVLWYAQLATYALVANLESKVILQPLF